ncbi:MAG: TIGR02221 family CRISPR-associated protein [Bacteroidia bacterium]|nr:TIGR02221 family CRISPR-associated protein [Bacteroidia bacterium]
MTYLVTNYVPCNYELEGIKIENVRFVQEAVVQILHQKEPFTEQDKVITFVTEHAKAENWEDKETNGEIREGLCTCLRRLNLPFQIKAVAIPNGFSEKEIWDIFQKVYESIEPRSTVYFDITHAFRFLPMLGMVLINYAQFLKEIEIGGIYYGAFEKLGSASMVKKMPLQERNAPILDLGGLISLNEWTNAANNFFEYGRAEAIQKLVNEAVKPFFVKKGPHQKPAIIVNKIAGALLDFTNDVITNRGKRICEGNSVKQIFENLNELEGENILPAFMYILRRIEEKLQNFQPATLTNAYYAIQWAIDNNWVQQAFTQMDEFLISFVLEQLGMDWKCQFNRQTLNKAVQIVSQDIPEDKWKLSNEEKTREKEIEWIHKVKPRLEEKAFQELMRIMNGIDSMRNSINHGGYNKDDNQTSKSLYDNLKVFFERLTQTLKTHWPDFLLS